MATKKTPTVPGNKKPTFEKSDSESFPEGFTALERIVSQKRRDGSEVVVERGWILSCEQNGKTYYAGRSGLWQTNANRVSGMFATEETAKRAAENIKQTWEAIAAHKAKVYETSEWELQISLAETNGRPLRPTQVQWRTTVDETRKIEAIRVACRQNNVEYAPGRPVVNNVDVLRYLFSLLP